MGNEPTIGNGTTMKPIDQMRRVRHETARRERWKSVPGYTNLYEASDQGKIRSINRVVTDSNKRKCKLKGRILKEIPLNGYPSVMLSKCGKRSRFKVHQLVMLSFVGRYPKGKEICHEDGDPTNNKLSNLRYDTPKGNAADKKRHGTHIIGSRHTKAKLTEEQVVKMRDEYACGNVTITKLANKYKVSRSTIFRILRHERWGHVGGANCSSLLKEGRRKASAKLTEKQVRAIREKYARGGVTQVRLAKDYGISERAVSHIINYTRWIDI